MENVTVTFTRPGPGGTLATLTRPEPVARQAAYLLTNVSLIPTITDWAVVLIKLGEKPQVIASGLESIEPVTQDDITVKLRKGGKRAPRTGPTAARSVMVSEVADNSPVQAIRPGDLFQSLSAAALVLDTSPAYVSQCFRGDKKVATIKGVTLNLV